MSAIATRQAELPFDTEAAAAASREDELDLDYLLRVEPPPPAVGGEPIAVVDLFAGCGGLTLGALEGARRAGRPAHLALAVDSDPAPLSVLESTLGASAESVSTADLGASLSAIGRRMTKAEGLLLDGVAGDVLLLAGPPCQGHSALNNHTRHDDPRNDLYLAVARAAELLSPRAVVVENTSAVGSDRRSAMAKCAAALESLGYVVDARRLDLHRIGVPQTRVRHLLVATRNAGFAWALPEAAGRSVAWAIGDLVDSAGETQLDTASISSRVNQERIEWLFEHDRYDLPNYLRPDCHQGEHSYVSMYGRLRWDAPAQTVTSGFGSMGQGRYVHPLRPRTLTPHEAARLQFLPDFLRLDLIEKRGALAQMIGNAAPPRLTIALVEALVTQGLL